MFFAKCNFRRSKSRKQMSNTRLSFEKYAVLCFKQLFHHCCTWSCPNDLENHKIKRWIVSTRVHGSQPRPTYLKHNTYLLYFESLK